MSASTAVMSPEVLDALMSSKATRKALLASSATKQLVLDWDAAKASREAAQAEAKSIALAEAYAPHLVDGYTFKDGTHMSFLPLVDFVQRTLAIKDTDFPAVWEAVSEAREALGDAMPTESKWKGLEALTKLPETK